MSKLYGEINNFKLDKVEIKPYRAPFINMMYCYYSL